MISRGWNVTNVTNETSITRGSLFTYHKKGCYNMTKERVTKWKMVAKFNGEPKEEVEMILERPELIERFGKQMPAVANPDFRYMELEIGEMYIIVKPIKEGGKKK